MATSATQGAGRLPPSSPLHCDRTTFDVPEDLDFETDSGRSEYGAIFGRLKARKEIVSRLVDEEYCAVFQLPRDQCADCALQKQGHRSEEFVYELRVLEEKMETLIEFRDSHTGSE